MTENYFHVKTNGDFTLAEFNGLEPKQEAVGGLIERVWLSDDRYMWANEEGLLQKLPINPIATAIAGQPIVGDVLLVEDSEDVSLMELTSLAFQLHQKKKADKVTE